MNTPSGTSKRRNKKAKGSRAAARLGAVQALFQLSRSPDQPEEVVRQFKDLRFGKDIDGVPFPQADEAFFADIVIDVCNLKDSLDEAIAARLTDKWRLERIDPLVLQILRGGAYELLHRPDVPTAVIIAQYVDVAYAFYDSKEPKFVNGLLDKMARESRAAPSAAPAAGPNLPDQEAADNAHSDNALRDNELPDGADAP